MCSRWCFWSCIWPCSRWDGWRHILHVPRVYPVSNKAMDQISQLPEDVIHHIYKVSCLPMQDIVRTSILSKRLKNAWLSFPILEFDKTFFGIGTKGKHDEDIKCKREKLINFVEQTLQNRCKERISIAKLVIDMPSNFCYSNAKTCLDRWIGYAVEGKISELILHFHFAGEGFYTLPQTVLLATSITVLALRGCKLEFLFKNMKLSLKRLTLFDVIVEDSTLHNLVSSCPGIEDLMISNCSELKCLKISGLPKLKRLVLHNCHMFEGVEIEALFHLRSFKYVGQEGTTCKISMSSCINLRRLVLYQITITEEYWFHNLFSECPLLDFLSLSSCQTPETIKISSHYLKRILLNGCKNLVEVLIDSPNLSSFGYSGDNIISLFLNSSVLSRAFIGYSSASVSLDTTWYVKEAEFLGKFNHCKHVDLVSRTGKNLTFPNELRQTLSPPLYGVKHLSVMLFIPLVDAVRFVEGLLWISPHLETICIVLKSNGKCLNASLEFLYENVPDRKQNHCFCTPLAIMCWRHCLKEINIKNFELVGDERDIKSFFC